MSRWLKAIFASSAFVLLCVYSFFPWEARADDIVITAGTLSEVSPFVPSPRYISWRAGIYEYNFGASASTSDDQSQPVTSTCAFPCGAVASFGPNPRAGLFTTTPIVSILHIDGQGYIKWFRGREVRFRLDNVIIPKEAAPGFTWTTQFRMSGIFWFSGYDLQTGFEPVTMIPFGNGIEGSAERYHYSLSNTNSRLRTVPTTSNHAPTGSFNFSKGTKPLVREHPVWASANGLRQMFEPQIPAQFWRRIDLGDTSIVPATRLPIR